MSVETRQRLHGGVVTQRIANPLPPFEKTGFLLQKTARRGALSGPFCKIPFAAAALCLALGACSPETPEAIEVGRSMGEACARTGAGAQACREVCRQEFGRFNSLGTDFDRDSRRACTVAAFSVQAAVKAKPDPAPDLAGGLPITSPAAEAAFIECMGEDRPHAECEAIREGVR